MKIEIKFRELVIFVLIAVLVFGGFEYWKLRLNYNESQNRLKQSYDDYYFQKKFIWERCVCVGWNNSADEPAMTKDQICSSPNAISGRKLTQ